MYMGRVNNLTSMCMVLYLLNLRVETSVRPPDDKNESIRLFSKMNAFFKNQKHRLFTAVQGINKNWSVKTKRTSNTTELKWWYNKPYKIYPILL